MVSPVLFKRNRQKLVKHLPPDSVAIVHSNDQMPRNGSQFFPYRQSSDFFYLTGINQEKSILVMAPHHPEPALREILFILPQSKTTWLWEGKKLTETEASAISGIDRIYTTELYEKKIKEVLKKLKIIYLLNRVHQGFPFEPDSRDVRYGKLLREMYPHHKAGQLAPVMSDLRMIKEPEEIEQIRKACSITAEAFRNILPVVRPGAYEYEIEAELTRVFKRMGAEDHAFAPIIAAGPNACIIHYTVNNKVCREGELLLTDFGAEYNNYASDCTRTIPVPGYFSTRQRKLYETVRRIYGQAEQLLKPGTSIEEVNREVNMLWEEEHIALGLYNLQDMKNQDPRTPLRTQYFPHGTSHFIGLDVHDPGDKQAILRPGMVLSCEPGLYIREEGTGIRLENVLLITEEGCENLMPDIPMDPDEIEFLMNRCDLK